MGRDVEHGGSFADAQHAAGAQALVPGGQAVLPAYGLYAPRPEDDAVAGAQAALVQQGGDLRVGVAVQQAVDPGYDALGGPVPLPGGKFGGQPQLAGRPAARTHAKSDLRAARDGDVLDQQPRHAFALAIRGRRIVPQAREVGGQGQDASAPGVVEPSRVLGAPLLEFPAGVVQSAQPGVPLGLQDIGHEPVVGMGLHEAPPRQFRLPARPLDGLGAPGIGLVGARGEFVLHPERDGQRDRGRQFTSNAPMARSMPAPGTDWHFAPAPAVRMPSRWQT